VLQAGTLGARHEDKNQRAQQLDEAADQASREN